MIQYKLWINFNGDRFWTLVGFFETLVHAKFAKYGMIDVAAFKIEACIIMEE